MKKQFLILGAVAVFGLVACGGGEEAAEEAVAEAVEAVEEAVEEEAPAAEASLVGTWQLSAMDLGIEVPEEQKAAMEESMQKAIESTSYTFGEDGSLTMISEMGEQNGTYEKDGNMIHAKTNKEESIEIGELTETTLVLLIKEEGMDGSMTFTRQ